MGRIVPRNIQSSLLFNGTSSRVSLGNTGNDLLVPPTFITVCAWVKTSGPGTSRRMMIFSRDGGDIGHIWQLGINASNKTFFRVFSSESTSQINTGTTNICDDKWHFVMGTWNGSEIDIMVDGQLDATPASFVGTRVNHASGYNSRVPYIGYWPGASQTEWFKGHITQAAVFTKGFSLVDHKSLFETGHYDSSYLMYMHDSQRDIINGSSAYRVHDVKNTSEGSPFDADLRDLQVPQVDSGNQIPIMKNLISDNAKGATIFNTASYSDQYLWTFNGNQYVVFVDSTLNVMLGKRTAGSAEWTIVDSGFNVGTDDDHNIATIGIDADGYIHLTYDHHGTTLNYAKSDNPEDITSFTSGLTMTAAGNENQVSYPKWFTANGFLFFAFRDGGSLDGSEYLNRYSPATQTWTRVAYLVDGRSYAYGTYPDSYAVDSKGRIHHSFCWRVDDNPAILYEHLTYMFSDDNGVTWHNTHNQKYNLPVTPDQAGDIISGNISLFWPQNHMRVDNLDRPHIGYAKASKRTTRDNQWHAFLDNGTWVHSQITDHSNTINALQTFGNYNFGRTNHVINSEGRVYQFGRLVSNGEIQVYTSNYPYTEWETFKLGSPPEGWGRMEFGGVDQQHWIENGTLNLLADQSTSANPTNLYVIEVDLDVFFNRRISSSRTLATNRSLASSRSLVT